MGGDEFLVFLTGTNQEEAQTFIDKVKLSLLSKPLVLLLTSLTLQASFGIAVYASNTSVDDMLKEADMHMYQDKQRQKQS
jgi:diguanylate cyclase (GGDEF)-like protein